MKPYVFSLSLQLLLADPEGVLRALSPSPTDPNIFDFMGVFRKNCQKYRVGTPRGVAAPSLETPGSTSGYYC